MGGSSGGRMATMGHSGSPTRPPSLSTRTCQPAPSSREAGMVLDQLRGSAHKLGARFFGTSICALVPDCPRASRRAGRAGSPSLGASLGFDGLRDGEPAACGSLARADRDRRGGRALAGHHRRQRLLPADVDALASREHLAVRPGVLAGLPLLPRARDVGHRDVHRAAPPSCSIPMRPTPCSTTGSGTSTRPGGSRRSMAGGVPCFPGRAAPSTARSRHRAHAPTRRTTSPSMSRWPLRPTPRDRRPGLRATGRVAGAAVGRRLGQLTGGADARGYEIRDRWVRESYEPVDNNAFTNMAAAPNAGGGVALCRSPSDGVASPPDGARSPTVLVLPRGRRRGVIVNHDGATPEEEQGGVPEGAAGLFPVGFRDATPSPGAGYLPLRRGGAGSPLRGRTHAQRAASGLCGPRRRTRPGRDAARARLWRLHHPPFLEPDELPLDMPDSRGRRRCSPT